MQNSSAVQRHRPLIAILAAMLWLASSASVALLTLMFWMLAVFAAAAGVPGLVYLLVPPITVAVGSAVIFGISRLPAVRRMEDDARVLMLAALTTTVPLSLFVLGQYGLS
ncbi:hypothetical protein [Streptomyces orinoci]|uniref:Uncharacterized protein n=1 Tax=Streptomyces orinoci TaxID=67339 RepID=A0ABV3K1B7_STRON|nr:hypothetical protein [Streptomyces orinoci]